MRRYLVACIVWGCAFLSMQGAELDVGYLPLSYILRQSQPESPPPPFHWLASELLGSICLSLTMVELQAQAAMLGFP